MGSDINDWVSYVLTSLAPEPAGANWPKDVICSYCMLLALVVLNQTTSTTTTHHLHEHERLLTTKALCSQVTEKFCNVTNTTLMPCRLHRTTRTREWIPVEPRQSGTIAEKGVHCFSLPCLLLLLPRRSSASSSVSPEIKCILCFVKWVLGLWCPPLIRLCLTLIHCPFIRFCHA